MNLPFWIFPQKNPSEMSYDMISKQLSKYEEPWYLRNLCIPSPYKLCHNSNELPIKHNIRQTWKPNLYQSLAHTQQQRNIQIHWKNINRNL